MATARAALKLRRLRQRFGIGAPRVAVRTHLPWHWRAAAVVGLVLLMLFAGSGVFDAGRRLAGFDSGLANSERDGLQQTLAAAEKELAELRTVAAAAESSIKIEKAAQVQLASQVRLLEQENAALKQDLAFFEGVIPGGDAASEVQIARLRVDPDNTPGRYRYRMLLVNNAGRGKAALRGELQLLLKVRQANKDVMIAHPPAGGGAAGGFHFEIKHFQRAEGEFAVPPGGRLLSVEAQLLQGGQVKARQVLSLEK